MPIKKAAFKHIRQARKRTIRNNQVKRGLKDFIKSVRKATVAKDQTKLVEYQKQLQQVIDKAAAKKIIKKKAASRRKSRLIRQVNKALKA